MASRPIPGTVHVAGTEVLYIEGKRKEHGALVDKVVDAAISLGIEPKGGVLSENVEIRTPEGTVFQGLTCMRDLDGWRRAAITLGEKENRQVAKVEGQRLVLFEPTAEVSYALDDCSITFFSRSKGDAES